jgi:uncharacterized protein (DUF169 family)
MNSEIARSMELKHPPIAIILADQKPEKAKQFNPGKWGCVMFMLAAAAKGETVAFDRQTFGCFGGGVGLGFENQYENFPGGVDGFCAFLSDGNDRTEAGRTSAEAVRPYLRPEAFDNFVHGERYLKSPDLVRKYIDSLPITNVPTEYVLFKPLANVDLALETPTVVVFLGDMDEISALTILANYHRGHNQNVFFPWAAGCQTLFLFPYHESKSPTPRAVLGLNDISARVYLKRLLKDDLMSFAAPYALFQEMEANVPGSFLERHTWKDLKSLK